MAIWRIPIMFGRPFGLILHVLRTGRQAVLRADGPHAQLAHESRLIRRSIRMPEEVLELAGVGGQMIELPVAHHVVDQLPIAHAHHLLCAGLSDLVALIEAKLVRVRASPG